jgi:hypothetical protein
VSASVMLHVARTMPGWQINFGDYLFSCQAHIRRAGTCSDTSAGGPIVVVGEGKWPVAQAAPTSFAQE